MFYLLQFEPQVLLQQSVEQTNSRRVKTMLYALNIQGVYLWFGSDDCVRYGDRWPLCSSVSSIWSLLVFVTVPGGTVAKGGDTEGAWCAITAPKFRQLISFSKLLVYVLGPLVLRSWLVLRMRPHLASLATGFIWVVFVIKHMSNFLLNQFFFAILIKLFFSVP